MMKFSNLFLDSAGMDGAADDHSLDALERWVGAFPQVDDLRVFAEEFLETAGGLRGATVIACIGDQPGHGHLQSCFTIFASMV